MDNSGFTFIDLFAGIGGMRIAMTDLGGKCVFSSEIDPVARSVYHKNFGVEPFGDIYDVDLNSENSILGDFDILMGGFPCQAFSIAGKREGFYDERGRLFFRIVEILEARKPKAFILENVKGLCSIDGGRTMEYILSKLRDINYYVPEPKVLDSSDFNVPQKRERVYIVGFRNDLGISDFQYPIPPTISASERKTVDSILTSVPVPPEYYLSQGYLDCLKRHKMEQHRKGHGFGYQILSPGDIPNTLLGGGMGRERNLVVDDRLLTRTTKTKRKTPLNDENVRCLTPREFSRIQGFPDDFEIGVSKTHAYRLFGNSVAIDVVYCVGLEVVKKLKESGSIEGYSVRDPNSEKYIYDLTKVD